MQLSSKLFSKTSTPIANSNEGFPTGDTSIDVILALTPVLRRVGSYIDRTDAVSLTATTRQIRHSLLVHGYPERARCVLDLVIITSKESFLMQKMGNKLKWSLRSSHSEESTFEPKTLLLDRTVQATVENMNLCSVRAVYICYRDQVLLLKGCLGKLQCLLIRRGEHDTYGPRGHPPYPEMYNSSI